MLKTLTTIGFASRSCPIASAALGPRFAGSILMAMVGTIFSLARKLNEEGISVLLVEQNVHQTLAIADYAYVLEKGRVVQSGEGRQLLNDPKVKEAYLGLA